MNLAESIKEDIEREESLQLEVRRLRAEVVSLQKQIDTIVAVGEKSNENLMDAFVDQNAVVATLIDMVAELQTGQAIFDGAQK